MHLYPPAAHGAPSHLEHIVPIHCRRQAIIMMMAGSQPARSHGGATTEPRLARAALAHTRNKTFSPLVKGHLKGLRQQPTAEKQQHCGSHSCTARSNHGTSTTNKYIETCEGLEQPPASIALTARVVDVVFGLCDQGMMLGGYFLGSRQIASVLSTPSKHQGILCMACTPQQKSMITLIAARI